MNGNFRRPGNGTIHGAIIADTASVAGNGTVPTQIDPPPGAPGAAAYDVDHHAPGRTRRHSILSPARGSSCSSHAELRGDPARRLRRRTAADDGFGLIELLIAMTMLAIAVGALLTVFASSAVSLRRAGQKGTALTLADTQMEKYRTRPSRRSGSTGR